MARRTGVELDSEAGEHRAQPALDLRIVAGGEHEVAGAEGVTLPAGEGFEILGHTLHLRDVKVPICAVACEADHIAPWLHSWKGVAQMGSDDRRFILSESGHIAGIINPPTKVKYGHYTSDAGFSGSADDWRKAAQYHEGSWWNRWGDWLAERSGPMVPARTPAESLGPAPGTYVLEKA